MATCTNSRSHQFHLVSQSKILKSLLSASIGQLTTETSFLRLYLPLLQRLTGEAFKPLAVAGPRAGRANSPSGALPGSTPTPDAKKTPSPVRFKHLSHFATKSDSSLQRPKKRIALKNSLTKLWTGFHDAQVNFWGYSGFSDLFSV
jgi:hypothetical protein